jgi:hypothetical protein
MNADLAHVRAEHPGAVRGWGDAFGVAARFVGILLAIAVAVRPPMRRPPSSQGSCTD